MKSDILRSNGGMEWLLILGFLKFRQSPGLKWNADLYYVSYLYQNMYILIVVLDVVTHIFQINQLNFHCSFMCNLCKYVQPFCIAWYFCPIKICKTESRINMGNCIQAEDRESFTVPRADVWSSVPSADTTWKWETYCCLRQSGGLG